MTPHFMEPSYRMLVVVGALSYQEAGRCRSGLERTPDFMERSLERSWQVAGCYRSGLTTPPDAIDSSEIRPAM
jgi:hypothetical protein